MNRLIYFCIILVILLLVVIYLQINNNILDNKEHFDNYGVYDTIPDIDKLLVKKTLNFKKIFENKKYSVWEPIPINDYYPLGHYISFNKNPPKNMGILVKNNQGKNSKDKPSKYEILSITNKETAIWKPVPHDTFISLGNIYSKNYPSKYKIRCVPKKYCQKSYIKNRLIENKISINDKGYELWEIYDSDLFICNNLNNKNNIQYLKNVYTLNTNYLDTEKKLYIRTTNSYTKICSYYHPKLNKKFGVWRPIAHNNFCSLGDICLGDKINPNNKLNTIVAHKSLCRLPLNYGEKPLYKLVNKFNKGTKENKVIKENIITFWRPVPHNNYYFFGDIAVIGSVEPDADNLIYSIPIDYLKTITTDTHKLVYNNVDNKSPMSIWTDPNNFFMVNNKYKNVSKNGVVLNNSFTYSNQDMMDLSRKIVLKYKINKNNLSKIDDNRLIDIIKDNLSSKLDINIGRLDNISINKIKNDIYLNIRSRNAGTKELSINDILKKINNILEHEDIKIYNENKDIFYMVIDAVFVEDNIKNINLDNSLFTKKISV